jgi:hypothetical protein
MMETAIVGTEIADIMTLVKDKIDISTNLQNIPIAKRSNSRVE